MPSFTLIRKHNAYGLLKAYGVAAMAQTLYQKE
jgi:hypothetical protein